MCGTIVRVHARASARARAVAACAALTVVVVVVVVCVGFRVRFAAAGAPCFGFAEPLCLSRVREGRGALRSLTTPSPLRFDAVVNDLTWGGWGRQSGKGVGGQGADGWLVVEMGSVDW